MEDRNFEKLAAEAASGLSKDQELYLDVKQELESHLEETAERFSREGHDAEESSELAKRAFGSPLDVAAELLAANRRRMRFRALVRLVLGTLIIPVAILAAVYIGTARSQSSQSMMMSVSAAQGPNVALPGPPFASKLFARPSATDPMWTLLTHGSDQPEKLRDYWLRHRNEPGSKMFYAYYALMLSVPSTSRNRPEHPKYLHALREGELVEPENAFYNMLLAEYYLKRGLREKPAKAKEPLTYELADRRAFDLGVREVLKAAKKPYLRTYQPEIARLKINAMPPPVLMEDYVQRHVVLSAELFPHLAAYREVARRTVGSARVLHSQGDRAKAEAVMDTWRPLTKFIVKAEHDNFIHQMVALAVGKILTQQGATAYRELGADDKARDAEVTHEKLVAITESQKEHRDDPQTKAFLRNHAPVLVAILAPLFANAKMPTVEEMKSGRMHEHVMAEEAAAGILTTVLFLMLLAAVFQAMIWFVRLRRAGSAVILLLPPAKVMAKSILLGAVLPMLIYSVYTRIPVIGGREFALTSYMCPRFVLEMFITAVVVLWLPIRFLRGYVRRRCIELDIPVPDARSERRISRRGWGAMAAAVVVGSAALFIADKGSPLVTTAGILLAILLVVAALWQTVRSRGEYGLYFGTLTRSIAPVYAIVIILLSVVVMPLQMRSEADLLRHDQLMYGYIHDHSSKTAGFTRLESEASQVYQQMILKALEPNRQVSD
jgi:hypothetical protein